MASAWVYRPSAWDDLDLSPSCLRLPRHRRAQVIDCIGLGDQFPDTSSRLLGAEFRGEAARGQRSQATVCSAHR